jgi:catechol 2,3-dioxygenase-like lactoylglutathione lyase family enzyme
MRERGNPDHNTHQPGQSGYRDPNGAHPQRRRRFGARPAPGPRNRDDSLSGVLDEIIGFAPAVDLDRARAFYRDALGLAVTDESPFAVVFRVGGTMLRVTKVDQVARAPYTILGWQTDDIEREIRALTERGVAFLRFAGMPQDDLGVWTTPGGDRVAWFQDPDGNTLSLTQFS